MSKTEHNRNGSVTPSQRLSSRRREQRGVALLMTIFGLLLLTAVAMAMMFSSDAETAISVNYRDSQIASYAAGSALQEARDRIQPLSGDLAVAGYLPTNTPDQGVANGGYVLYILNPASNETAASIAPWNWNNGNNAYFDQELCQENMLTGLGVVQGTPGVPCSGVSAVPAAACTNIVGGGASWCRYYDNSANATSWQIKDTNGNKIPLDYKWVRVSMKQDKNTPVYVPSFASASGKQVCWDGNYQTQLPANYNPATCYPTGGNSVIGLNLTAAGANFTSAPTILISGGGGSGATATAQIGPAPGNGIASVVLTNAGSGYTTPPTVTISPSGATFQAVVASSTVTGVNVNSSGTNYCYKTGVTPTVNFSTSPITNTISNATATATMTSPGCISQASSSSKCSGFNLTSGTPYAITSATLPGTGSGFAGSVTFGNGNKVSGISLSNVGSGYTSGTGSVKIKDNSGNTCTVGSVSFTTGAQLSSITVAAGNGGAYMSQPAATLGGTAPAAPASPIKPALTALPNPWSSNAAAITAVNVTAPGTGYTPGTHYPLTFTGGGGTGAAGYAVGGGTFVVSGLTVTNGGAGYTTAPTVTISGGGGTGATGTATIAVGGVNTSMGQVYVLTSFAMTKTGSKSMAQMETGARPPFTFNLGGAITLPGTEPAANFVSPNSNNFIVNGNDAAGTIAADPAGCSGKSAAKPAIGVWDSQSQTNVIGDLGKPQNFTGSGGTPSVEVVYAALGGADVTPSNLDSFVSSLQSSVTSPVLPSVPGVVTTSLPATTTSSVTYVDGDLSLSGNVTGNGVLVVTGTLTLSGDFTWNGIVLVVGQGQVVHNGGGNGNFNGAIYVAKTKDAAGNELSAVGNPNYTWNGGGTNQIQYDHCLADGLLSAYEGTPSSLPLQILSMRTLQF